MKPFTKKELIGVILILLAVFVVTLQNLKIAVRRSRDSQRRSDLGAISDALHKYHTDFGFFPPSQDGKIKLCKGDFFQSVVEELKGKIGFDKNKFFEGLAPCLWGKDKFVDLFDEAYPAYLNVIPIDAKSDEGVSYLYLSNTQTFQLFAYLEGEASEDGYDSGIVSRNLACGSEICSYGKSYAETPLDKSIEEYEQELLDRSRLD